MEAISAVQKARLSAVTRALHYVGNIAPLASSVLTAPLTARSLGTDSRGQLAIIMLAGSLTGAVCALGLSWVVRVEFRRSDPAYRLWYSFSAVASVAAVGPCTLVGFVIAGLLGVNAWTALAIALFLAVMGTSSFRSVAANAYVSLGEPHKVGLSNLLLTSVVLIGSIVLFIFKLLTLNTILYLNSTAILLQSLALIPVVKATLKGGSSQTGSLRVYGSLYKVVLRSWSVQLLEIIATRLDIVLLTIVGNVGTVGLYSIDALLPQAGYQVCVTEIQRFAGRSRALGVTIKSPGLVRMLIVRCILTALVLGFAGMTGGLLLIPVIFGQAYSGARQYLPNAVGVLLALSVLAPALADAATSAGRRIAALPIGFASALLLACITARAANTSFALCVLALGVAVTSFYYMWPRIRKES